MAEVEILFPTVQYGNVKLRATPEELGLDGPADAYALGVQSAVLLNLFTQGFKTGSQLDVSGAPAPSAEPTENEAQAAVQEIRQQLGATVVEDYDAQDPDGPGEEHSEAPWTSPPVDAKPKPWENGGKPATPKVAVAEIDWS